MLRRHVIAWLEAKGRGDGSRVQGSEDSEGPSVVSWMMEQAIDACSSTSHSGVQKGGNHSVRWCGRQS